MPEILKDECRVELENQPSRHEVETLWRELEENSDCHFFLSWHWISAWLKSVAGDVRLLKIYVGTDLIAMGFISMPVARRVLRFFRSRQISLNETGEALRDQQWIEYNGLIAAEKHRAVATRAAVRHLLEADSGWDELLIGVIPDSEAKLYVDSFQLRSHVKWESVSHAIQLDGIDSMQTYLRRLSKNTRYQISKSVRLYQSSGDILVKSAKTPDEAKQMLRELAPHHIARWGSGFQESGFANQYFVEFHEALIDASFNAGSIDVLRITAGTELVGYFYNLLYRGRVYFYLSALPSVSDNKLRPGLVGHSLLVEHYASRGFSVYDLMGGGESYKDRMATRGERFLRISIQRETIPLIIERYLRGVRDFMRSTVCP